MEIVGRSNDWKRVGRASHWRAVEISGGGVGRTDSATQCKCNAQDVNTTSNVLRTLAAARLASRTAEDGVVGQTAREIV